jgi:hypothetical protein
MTLMILSMSERKFTRKEGADFVSTGALAQKASIKA